MPTFRKRPLAPNKRFYALWLSLTPTQRVVFAKHVKSTVGSLKHTAYGRRRITTEMAALIEKATVRMSLDPINRVELSQTCADCSYAKACLGAKLT